MITFFHSPTFRAGTGYSDYEKHEEFGSRISGMANLCLQIQEGYYIIRVSRRIDDKKERSSSFEGAETI